MKKIEKDFDVAGFPLPTFACGPRSFIPILADIADLDGGSVAEITFPNPNNLTSFKVKVGRQGSSLSQGRGKQPPNSTRNSSMGCVHGY